MKKERKNKGEKKKIKGKKEEKSLGFLGLNFYIFLIC